MKVKIKTWDKMVKKYGVSECGKEIELEDANSGYDFILGKYDGYYIEKWMVKKNGKQRQSYKS